MAVSINKEKVAEAAVVLKRIMESEVKEGIATLAGAIKQLPDSPQKDDALSNGKKIQDSFNEELPAVNSFLDDLETTCDLADVVAKISAQQNIDTSSNSADVARANKVNMPGGLV